MNLIDSNIEHIRKLCNSHKVNHLYVFGSVLSNEFSNESDIDLIVDFAPMDLDSYASNYYNLKFSLQQLFKRPIDLLENQAIKNPFFRQTLDEQKKLIYGHSD
jgi:predicted nucleotidyltransferase